MEFWQRIVLGIYGGVNFLLFLKGFYECKYKKKAYTPTPALFPFGAFVWGDAVVFGLFWVSSALISCLLNDWVLFLLIISLFWVVRSLGETIYWFNQQFSSVNRNSPEKLTGFAIFHNDSIWYIYQIVWQCVTVVSLVFSIYFSALWLRGKF